jgi:acetyl-CoA acetyltransferase
VNTEAGWDRKTTKVNGGTIAIGGPIDGSSMGGLGEAHLRGGQHLYSGNFEMMTRNTTWRVQK